jgi:hypothetical protein
MLLPRIFLLLLVGCSQPHDHLIVPGKRVGNWVLGRTQASDVGPVDGSISLQFSDPSLGMGLMILAR